MATISIFLRSSFLSRSRATALRAHASLSPRGYSTAEDLKKTPLFDFHLSNGGKMVPFAGWSMPVQYSDLSVINSSLHTRSNSSLFDVSHMLQTLVSGEGAEKFLEYLTVANLANLKNGSAVLSMFTTAQGGIIDDCIITRTGSQSFFVVSNAGRADVINEHLQTQLREFGYDKVALTPLNDRALVALQGPKSASVLQEGVKGDLSQLKFMSSAVMSLFGILDCRVSRCGYTGEDGFEISVPSTDVIRLVDTLLAADPVKLAGLGARDVLRLEAGLCLYGNDISEETTPIEASLAWCIDKTRRKDGNFLGADRILQQLKDKPSKRRVGLELGSGPPAREGCQVIDSDGHEIGYVTSGTPSPTLQYNVAMAYLPRQFCKTGTVVNVQIRKHTVNGRVAKMPFVPSRYYI